MKKICISILGISFFIFMSSCNKNVIKGTGSIGTKAFLLPEISAVEAHYDIKANITHGQTQEVSAIGYDNLLNLLDFKVEAGVLKLKFNTTYNTIRNGNVVVNIQIPTLMGVKIHGSQNIDINNFTNGNMIQATIHGSGSIKMNGNSYNSAFLEIYGSGNIDAKNLQTPKAEVKVHGSGNVFVSVSNILKAGIFGSGNIFYWGNPALEITQNGSGRIIKR